MNLLYSINAIVCLIFLIHGIKIIFFSRSCIYHTVREEVISISVVLVTALSLARSAGMVYTEAYNPLPLLEYCFIGLSLFQLLISHMVLDYMQEKINEKSKG